MITHSLPCVKCLGTVCYIVKCPYFFPQLCSASMALSTFPVALPVPRLVKTLATNQKLTAKAQTAWRDASVLTAPSLKVRFDLYNHFTYIYISYSLYKVLNSTFCWIYQFLISLHIFLPNTCKYFLYTKSIPQNIQTCMHTYY